MLVLYYAFLKKPLVLLLAYVLQAVPYWLLMKKLGKKPFLGLIPSLAEYKLSRKVFKRHRSFWRPFILTAILLGLAYYVDPYEGVGILYVGISCIVWGIFLARLYGRLGKAFGKKVGFRIGMILLPPVFLTMLALSKAEYTAPEFKPDKERAKWKVVVHRVCFVLLSVVELLAIVAGFGFLAIRQNPPAVIIQALLKEHAQVVSDVGPTGYIVTREDMVYELSDVIEENQSRDYYFSDHADDQNVVVFVYVIGSNLESDGGTASANIQQMIDATKQGSCLKFIMEAGGSERWFTQGMAKNSYARYEISGGKLTKIEDLPEDTNMADAQTLTDFLTWGGENYAADRNMLVLWDHGGGVSMGFGEDSLNGTGDATITIPQLSGALEQAGMQFDLIGFDACLMQDIEIADALAPYADYYIASEEEEDGYGWYYTPAFGDLAQNPGMDTVEFGEELIASYDPYNTAWADGVPNTASSLSMIDLSLVESTYDQLSAFLDTVTEKITEDPACFEDVSLAAAHAYNFQSYQIDLYDFLKILDGVDYYGDVVSDEELYALEDAVLSCVVCRNGVSVDGINGLAIAMPYGAVSYYDYTSQNLADLSMDSEKKAFDTIFSIMAAQQAKTGETVEGLTGDGDDLMSMLTSLIQPDYTECDWYITGFEDYDDTAECTGITLNETDYGFEPELPSNTWETITDLQSMVYQQVDDDGSGAVRRYLGNDYYGSVDGSGHRLIAPDGNWVYICGRLVCYEAEEADQVGYTNEDEYASGRVKAKLNGEEEIYIAIEWEVIDEGETATPRILGYTAVEDAEESLPERGYEQFTAGDIIQFEFDYYDADGKFVETRTDGRIVVTDPDRLKVTDEPLKPCTLEFGGMMHDVYGRILTTEMVTVEITDR